VGSDRGARERERGREAVRRRHAGSGDTVSGGAIQTGFEPIQNLNGSHLILNSFKLDSIQTGYSVTPKI
jgi:hypothetical protein